MTENKRFELCVDSNNRKSIWDNENKEGEPLLCLNRFNEMWGIDEVYDLLNEQDARIKYLERKFERERCATQKQHLKWSKQAEEQIKELEDKLKRIEKEVDCNVYRDDLKDIILEIRCILDDGDVE